MPDLRRACAVILAAALGACAPAETPRRRLEFDRRLRAALEQMRRALPESAEAELSACARIDADDPELLFQEARLALFARGSGPDWAKAEALLSRSLKRRGGSVRARRLLAEVERRLGRPEKAEEELAALRREYGALGELELEALWAQEHAELGAAPRRERRNAAEALRFAQAYKQLDPMGGSYDPPKAVLVITDILERHPDLAALRLAYAQWLLDSWFHLPTLDRPDLPLLSSKLVLDVARGHLEKTFDQADPGSELALKARHWLLETAVRQGDWEEVLTLSAILRRWPGGTPWDERVCALEAQALMRTARPKEAVRVLERALSRGPRGTFGELQNLWLLHMAQDQAKIPGARRRRDFPFARYLVSDPARSPVLYEDIAHSLGVGKLQGLGPAAWGDVARRGEPDLFISGLDSYGSLLRREGARFVDVSRQAGLSDVRSGFSATFADYDNDGWPDLFIGRLGWAGRAPSSLFHNNRDGTFTEVTDKAGVATNGSSFVHVWTDYNRDGYQDLYVANGIARLGDTNVLYRNNGDGTFTDVTRKAGLQEPKGTRTIGVAVGDYDGDGWPDIFVSGYETENRLYHNRGDGTFEEVAGKAGVADPEHKCAGYIAFFLDYDNDGRPDILRTCEAPWEAGLLGLSSRWDSLPEAKKKELLKHSPRLYRNNGDGTFTDVTRKAGLEHPIGVMGGMVGDLDNDGYVDIYLATGGPDPLWQEPDRFFHNNGDGTFTDLTFAASLGNTGKGHGTTFVDLQGNGGLDVFVDEGGFVMGDPWPCAYYRNRKPLGNHWLEVDLEGTKSNRDAVDARVTVEAGPLRLWREMRNGEGFGSSNPRTLHFGLGKNTAVELLEVRWPSGLVQTFKGLAADQRIAIREAEPWRPWKARKAKARAAAAKAGIEWVKLPGGAFQMGSDKGDPEERPRHEVAVRPFELAKTLATNAQYGACVADGACTPSHLRDGTCFTWDGARWGSGTPAKEFLGPEHPVVCVDFEQARAFARWAGGRLPTEAEWEYAARSAGKDRLYPWGDEPPTCAKSVISEGGVDGCGRRATWPVCSKPAGDTEQGLCDMAGDAWQWTEDVYGPYPGAPGGSARNEGQTRRVLRGGSWLRNADGVRATHRSGYDPHARCDAYGIRVAR